MSKLLVRNSRMMAIGLSFIACHLSFSPAGAQTMPYQNPDLSSEERAADLCSRLTLHEKVRLMRNGSPAIERLGIKNFDWWSEALHGVGRQGVCTVFPSCIGMACSFDDELVSDIFTAVSDEARAKFQIWKRKDMVGKYHCLSFWTPTVNVFRDPRWGRGQETYGEDPYQNGRMGVRVVKALQGDPTPARGKGEYYKLLACAKHFAVHSGPEGARHSMNIENLSARDLWETYLPAFKDLVQKGNVQEVMCAYQRFEGDPCCGSNKLLQKILRDEWGFKGLVVSDCGAITDFWKEDRHNVSKDQAAASAKAVIAGTDVECGANYNALEEAVERGDITEEQINTSVRRLLKGRFDLGEMDPDSLVSWTRIPESVIASSEHKALARQMAREQMVLLKNNGVLPLKSEKLRVKNEKFATASSKLMVMGPNAADSTVLWGIYFGQPSHTVTMLEGIEARVGKVKYTPACDITNMTVKQRAIESQVEAADGSTTLKTKVVGERTYTIDEIVESAKDAETVVFIGGISPSLEREQTGVKDIGFRGGDRTTIELPQVQRDILRALHEAGKRVVLVCCSGSAVALAPEEEETCDAIIEAWYAGEQGGHALADVLFGDYNPSGRLAVTFYRDDSQLPDFEDYSMQNRTYRYFRGEPLYPFGYGLSYTSFQFGKPSYSDGKITVDVKNTGKRAGTEIVQVYLRRTADAEGPLKTLRGYARVDLKKGQKKTVTIDLPRENFETWDAATNTMRVIGGEYELMVGPSSADKDLQKLKVTLGD